MGGENDAIRQIAVTATVIDWRAMLNWREAGLTGVNVSVDSLDASVPYDYRSGQIPR